MTQPDWRWPHWTWPAGKRIAVVFNVCLEAWSDGKAPGIGPMGNPLPAGALDTMAISWAAYGVEVGIHRLMDGLANHGAKASVMVNAIIAERSPQTVRARRNARAPRGRDQPPPKPAIAGMATCSISIFRASSAMATAPLSPFRWRMTSMICRR